MTTLPGRPKRDMPVQLRLLFQSQFGLFFFGNSLSMIGTWTQRIACSWLVWEWTESAFWLGVLAAGDLLPVVAIAPLSGVAADRWDRLTQNRIAQLVSAGLAITLAALFWTDNLDLLLLLLLVTGQGVLIAAVQPARLAMVGQMVARDDLGVAIALNSVNVNLARLFGPAVAGVMILYVDIVWVFLLNTAVTLLFAGILGRMRLAPRDTGPAAGDFLSQMREGFAYVLRMRALCLVLGVMLLGGSLVRSVLELVPALAARPFDDTAKGLAMLTGSAGVGAVIAGLSVRRSGSGSALHAVMLWWALGAVSASILATAPVAAVAVPAAVAAGLTITRGLVQAQTYVQMTTPDAFRGRTLSVHGMIARGSPALGALLIGYAADRIGLPRAVTISSCCMLVVLAALTLVLRRRA